MTKKLPNSEQIERRYQKLISDNPMTTTHNLEFRATNWRSLGSETARILDTFGASDSIRNFLSAISKIDHQVQLFKVGSCNGVWYATPTEYRILFVCNGEKGNGHFTDVLEWFEESARRDKRTLVFEEVINDRLRKHLVEKKGFKERGRDCVKDFTFPTDRA